MKTKRERLNLSMPRPLLVRVKNVARDENRSSNSLITAFIRLGLMFKEGRLTIYEIDKTSGKEVPVSIVML